MSLRRVTAQTITVPLTAMVPTADGHGRTRRTVGSRTAQVTLEIDVELLMHHYAAKAASSKGRKATAANGGVVLRASNVKDDRPPTA